MTSIIFSYESCHESGPRVVLDLLILARMFAWNLVTFDKPQQSMDHKKKLEELHKEAFKNFDAYVKSKGKLEKEHDEKLQEARTNWQNAWNKLVEAMMVLERLEI